MPGVAEENFTSNVSDPSTGMLGSKVSVPSVKPEVNVGEPNVRVAVPVFLTVNVRTTSVFTGTVPKSVPSDVSGVVSPSGILKLNPVTSISGARLPLPLPVPMPVPVPVPVDAAIAVPAPVPTAVLVVVGVAPTTPPPAA